MGKAVGCHGKENGGAAVQLTGGRAYFLCAGVVCLAGDYNRYNAIAGKRERKRRLGPPQRSDEEGLRDRKARQKETAGLPEMVRGQSGLENVC